LNRFHDVVLHRTYADVTAFFYESELLASTSQVSHPST